MNVSPLIPHLFRQESGKIIAALTRYWGIEHVDVAEDITSETFLKALETWPYHGIPENPVAWLYRVARNLSLNYLKRNQVFRDKVAKYLENEIVEGEISEEIFQESQIRDGQLQMLFAICNTPLPMESQIILALRTLCGFGIDEIANALLVNKEKVNKRLYRAKEKLRENPMSFSRVWPSDFSKVLPPVLTTLYLLYNEGYYSENQNQVLRKDLCLEAMRLTFLLVENETTKTPEVNAVLALMSFHASRFEARVNPWGEMILYDEQKTEMWNQDLIEQGIYFLNRSAQGNRISTYHFEAYIAYYYTRDENSLEKWNKILDLFDQLILISDNPIIRLNRLYAFYRVFGVEKAIIKSSKLPLENNHYLQLLLGVLHQKIDSDAAIPYFKNAFELATSETERKYIKHRYLGR